MLNHPLEPAENPGSTGNCEQDIRGDMPQIIGKPLRVVSAPLRRPWPPPAKLAWPTIRTSPLGSTAAPAFPRSEFMGTVIVN